MKANVLNRTWLRRVAICLFLAVCGVSQATVKVEYFIDSDPGIGNATQQTVSSSNVVLTIPTSGISPGVHTLSVRACDENGNWSATVTDPLYVVEAVGFKRIEYYVDNDPGEGSGIPVDISSEPIVTFVVPTGDLNIGDHTLVVRGCDLNGNYSSIVETQFSVTGVEATGITLDKTEATLMEGESFALTTSIAPENATDKSVSWESSDTNVATVSENGVITAINAGSATITATTSNGLSATCNVTVEAKVIDASSIVLDSSEVNLTEGEVHTLVATIYPENATDKSVSWESSDTNVATVSENGVVTAVGVGTTIITATTSNELDAKCTVNVTEKVIEATGITLDIVGVILVEGDIIPINATVVPENTTDKTVYWTSSNPDIATVSDSGVVTAVSQGTATITAVTHNGLKAECSITVEPANVLVTDITLDQKAIEAESGTEIQLIVCIYPDNATNKTLIWTSSNEDVAIVDEDGLVTVINEGSAIITVTAADGSGIATTCQVIGLAGLGSLINDEDRADVYTINGLLIKKDANREYMINLAKGIYILNISGKVYKVMVR